MLWLNVQEIPKRADGDESSLLLAIMQRIKVFYRPKGLPGDLYQAMQNIEWRYHDNSLQITNPSPYHVTVVHLAANNKQIELALVVPPQQTYTVALPSAHNVGPHSSLTYSSISDLGVYIKHQVQLSGEQPSKGELVAN